MNTLRPFVPDRPAVDRALADVFYEIQQLLESSQLASNDPLVMNAFLESWLVHVRVLLDFFERNRRSIYRHDGDRRENDDVLCTDFGFSAKPVGVHRKWRGRLNKDLVHLSYSRGDRKWPRGKEWPKREVVLPLIKRSIEFIDSLDPTVLADVPGVSARQWADLREKLVMTSAGFAGLLS